MIKHDPCVLYRKWKKKPMNRPCLIVYGSMETIPIRTPSLSWSKLYSPLVNPAKWYHYRVLLCNCLMFCKVVSTLFLLFHLLNTCANVQPIIIESTIKINHSQLFFWHLWMVSSIYMHRYNFISNPFVITRSCSSLNDRVQKQNNLKNCHLLHFFQWWVEYPTTVQSKLFGVFNSQFESIKH